MPLSESAADEPQVEVKRKMKIVNVVGAQSSGLVCGDISDGFFGAGRIESWQIFLPGRTANISDMIANTLGAVGGLWCFRPGSAVRP